MARLAGSPAGASSKPMRDKVIPPVISDERWLLKVHVAIDNLNQRIFSLTDRLEVVRGNTLGIGSPACTEASGNGVTAYNSVQEAYSRLNDACSRLDELATIVSDLESL